MSILQHQPPVTLLIQTKVNVYYKLRAEMTQRSPPNRIKHAFGISINEKKNMNIIHKLSLSNTYIIDHIS